MSFASAEPHAFAPAGSPSACCIEREESAACRSSRRPQELATRIELGACCNAPTMLQAQSSGGRRGALRAWGGAERSCPGRGRVGEGRGKPLDQGANNFHPLLPASHELGPHQADATDGPSDAPRRCENTPISRSHIHLPFFRQLLRRRGTIGSLLSLERRRDGEEHERRGGGAAGTEVGRVGRG